MAIRDLMVVFDGSERDAVVLNAACEFGRRDQAHILGVCPLDLLFPGYLGPVIGGYPDAIALRTEIERLEAMARARAAKIEAMFREQLRRDDAPGEWHLASGPPNEEALWRARHVDAVVLSQPSPDPDARIGVRYLVEDVLLRSGRPVLFVPYAGHAPKLGANVLVAWNGSREATRALHDVLPLLDADASITVLVIDRPGDRGEQGIRGAEIAEHIARHRFRTTMARTVADRSLDDADVILDYAADTGADLLVMGGYGHSRTREMVLGGVTRALLDHMTLPTLMSH